MGLEPPLEGNLYLCEEVTEGGSGLELEHLSDIEVLTH